jgi:hypothetical protein
MLTTFGLMLPVLILFCGLSLDLGMLEWREQQMQSAADAAAISAELEAERGTENWVALGQEDASQNGFTNGSQNTTVNVVQFANYGAYNGRYDGLQVTITQKIKTIFMGALNGGYVTATARSVAQITPCVYLTGTGTISTSGGPVSAYPLNVYTGSFNGNSCPVYANAKIDIQSSGKTAMEAINVVGPASASILAGSVVYPPPLFNVPAFSDPLSAISQPTLGSCTVTSYSISGGSATLNPGTYCKGMSISYATVKLNPGLYIITGGASWYDSTITGNGVTLYFTKGGGATTYGQFYVGFSTLTLSAPTVSYNNSIPGILVFADRNWSATGAQDFQLISDTWNPGDGIWYLTHAGMEIWSCNNGQILSGTNYFGIYADNLFTAGTIVMPLNNYSYVTGGNPFRTKAPLVQ